MTRYTRKSGNTTDSDGLCGRNGLIIPVGRSGCLTALIPAEVAEPLLLVATGGTYFDEVTGTQVPVGGETALLG